MTGFWFTNDILKKTKKYLCEKIESENTWRDVYVDVAVAILSAEVKGEHDPICELKRFLIDKINGITKYSTEHDLLVGVMTKIMEFEIESVRESFCEAAYQQTEANEEVE